MRYKEMPEAQWYKDVAPRIWGPMAEKWEEIYRRCKGASHIGSYTTNSDFGKEVADTYRQLKGVVNAPAVAGTKPVDPSVREQVNADLDHMIEKHEARKPYPGILP